MDERLSDIKEGAGREESRLNTELIEFLQGPIFTGFLVVVVIISLGYTGLRWWDNKKIQQRNAAFGEFAAAAEIQNPIPESISAVINNTSFDGVASVQTLARLRLAGIYLTAHRTSLEPGAEFDPATGELLDPDTSLLTDEQRENYLNSANSLYQEAFDATQNDAAKGLIAAQAAFGLAAVAESKGDAERAKSMYERAGELATAGGYSELGQIATARAESVDSLPESIELATRDSLPPIPGSVPQPMDITPQILPPEAVTPVDETVGPIAPDQPADDGDAAEDDTAEPVEAAPPADPPADEPDGR